MHEKVEQVDCERLRRLGIDFLHVSVESLGLSPTNLSESSLDQATRLIQSIRDRGLGVQVYTVNDPKPDGMATALARIGVEGLFTDHPSETRRLFDTPPPGAATGDANLHPGQSTHPARTENPIFPARIPRYYP